MGRYSHILGDDAAPTSIPAYAKAAVAQQAALKDKIAQVEKVHSTMVDQTKVEIALAGIAALFWFLPGKKLIGKGSLMGIPYWKIAGLAAIGGAGFIVLQKKPTGLKLP